MTDDDIIAGILLDEGGFVHNLADPGGATNFGITQETLGASRGHPVSIEDVRQLTEAEARQIYQRRYITGPGFGRLTSPALRGVMADCCVLHGERNAVRMLQRALGIRADALLGPLTESRANGFDGRKLALLIEADRIKFLGRHITNDLTDTDKDGIPDATEFAAGWFHRIARQIETLV
jgi:lysozyme family protein